jgi:transketolase
VNTRLREAGVAEIRLEHADPATPRQPAKPQRLIDAYGRALLEAGERNGDLVVLDADLAYDTGLAPFRTRFPERFIECGIAEQDMVSQAGGMALRGLLPVVHSFACFLSARACEQIYNNATERTRIVYVGALAGVLPAGPGHSHQGIRDISTLGSIPDMIMLQPACESEVPLALDFCLRWDSGPSYLRLVSVPCEVPYDLPEGYRLEPGRGAPLRAGRDVVLFAHGPVLLGEAVRAARSLQSERGISVEVINLPWLNRVDALWLGEAVRRFEHVFALDDHYLRGGQGDLLADALAAMSSHPPLHRLGVRGLPPCGSSEEVLARCGLDAASVAREIERAALGR